MLELNAVIFDMDGLMIDTEPVGKMLVKTSHEKFGYEITEEMFYHLIGTNEKTSKAYYHSVFGEDYPYQKIKDYRDQLRKEYFNSHPLEVKKGLYDLLEDLKKKNIKMAVASSTRYERVLSNLKSIKVDHYFNAIIGGDQIQHGKPAPHLTFATQEPLNALRFRSPLSAWFAVWPLRLSFRAVASGNLDTLVLSAGVQFFC